LNNVEGHTAFEYEFLLKLVSDHVTEKEGGDTGSASTFKLVEPKCGRTKTKSTWVNFEDQRVILDRKAQHILDFYLSELGCSGNIGATGEMVLVGGYQPKHFLRLIRKYIEEYVRCRDCRGYTSELVREDKSRLTYVKCKICQASRVVTTHNESRFRGVKRGERRAAR
jgi:translation initiation factor 2 subunit 2